MFIFVLVITGVFCALGYVCGYHDGKINGSRRNRWPNT